MYIIEHNPRALLNSKSTAQYQNAPHCPQIVSLLPLTDDHCLQIVALFRLRLYFFDNRRKVGEVLVMVSCRCRPP